MNDSILKVDVDCGYCGKLIALSYTVLIDGRHACPRCTGSLGKGPSKLAKERKS